MRSMRAGLLLIKKLLLKKCVREKADVLSAHPA